MARMHDGITIPLGPGIPGLLVGVAVIAGGVVSGLYVSWLIAVPLILVGLLVAANNVTGSTRVRVTHSKLLVEHDRPVRTFLIGARKERVAWTDYQGSQITEADGAKVLQVQGSPPLALGRGAPDDELTHLKELADGAAKRFREEQALG